MNVKELKQLLADFADDDMEVVFIDSFSLTPFHFNQFFVGQAIGGLETLIITDADDVKEFKHRSSYLSGYTIR